MPTFIAVVKVEDDRPVKFAEFDNRQDADAHVAEHGGFVAVDPPGNSFDWKVKGQGNGRGLKKEKKAEQTPRSVSRYQFKMALATAGELAATEEAMASMEPSGEVRLYWEESATFHTLSGMVLEFKKPEFTAISDVDAIFRVAGKVRQ